MKLKNKGLSSLWLSAAAALSMTLDHAAVMFLKDDTCYLIFRAAGRIAFVIFAFLIAQSIEKTSSVKRFCIRLFIFAVMTEPVFDISFYGKALYPAHQNVFFTLLFGVFAVWAYRESEKYGVLAICTATVLAQLLGFDYGGIGVILIFAFWFWGRDNIVFIVAVFSAVTALSGKLNLFALAAIPFLQLYNGKRGGERYTLLRRWFFYLYYPLHIAALGIISRCFGG